ncbi:response regulator [Mucilaginibacter lutimaris]|uniref:Response regulator n=1 Tax=Mucilaginibacter lutimaris TaxID=931629 RepID=A0ABW2ZL37_9SPHI
MCKLVMIDDNPLEHLIMKKIFARHHLFNEAVHSIDSKLIIDFLTEKCNDALVLPDLIFLDLDMPGFSGWDFLESFAKLLPCLAKQITIYIISSSVDQNDMLRARNFSFVKEFISKPVEIEKLEEIHFFHKRLSA